MKYCVKCGRQVEDTMKFCPVCGAEIPNENTQNKDQYQNQNQYQQNTYQQSTYQQNTYEYGSGQYNYNQNNTSQHQATNYEKKNKLMAVLSYLGLLVFVPVLAGNDSKFVKFHANQGLVLFILEVIWSIFGRILHMFDWIMSIGILSISNIVDLLDLVFLILAVIGIVNVCKGEENELPIIGAIRIIK